jgi:predicted aldo/keto reductase-like oxidoreductase
MNRRDFLKQGTAAMAMLASSGDALASTALGAKTEGLIAKRTLGSTGEKLSIFGFPGTAVMHEEQSVANNLVAEAFDRGVNFFDVSPTYGNAEERLGSAFEPYRKRCFLASKTDSRDKAGAEKDIDNSLKILRTDHLDLYQHHAVERADLDRILAPGGAAEAFLAAKKAGKVRFLGLSAHSVEIALDAIEHLPLDTIMFPVNFVLFEKANFGPQVIERARAKKMGIFAIKAMARGKYPANLPQEKKIPKCWYEPCTLPEESALAYRWTLGQDIDVNIPSGNKEMFRLALDTAQNYKPLSEDERKRLFAYAEKADPLFTLEKKG